MVTHIDILIGRIALERGLITRDQLVDALKEQADVAPERPALGQVLLRRGVIRQTDLDSLLDEQKRRLAEALEIPDAKLEDSFLGRLMVKQGLITEKQFYECLREQAELSEHGKPVPRIGEILVRKKFLATDAVTNALQLDKKASLSCPKCGARYHTSTYDPRETYSCKKCPGKLIVHDAETTTGLLPISHAPLPEDVELANADPANRYAEGKYIRVKEVGRGGMGIVWKAWQSDLERYIAIKQMTQSVWSETEQKRFFREAQTAARLSHPNIATIYEVGIHEGNNFIAMEFVDGDALSVFNMISPATATRHGGPERRTVKHLPLKHAIEVLRDAAGAVEYAHSKGVIHRDIKPHNIMLGRSGGRVFVMDFGLAKPVHKEGITMGDSILGTPPYMSPEQARGDTVDRRTDVYSLGAVLYYLITGKAPYSGASPADTLMKVLTEDPPLPHAINPAVAPDLEKICMKALEKDRHRRYESAKAFAEDLSRFLKGEPVRARPMSLYEKGVKWGSHNTGKVILIGVALVAALMVGLFNWTARSRAQSTLTDRLTQAQTLLKSENYIRALAEYQAVLALDPANPVAEQGFQKCETALREGRALVGDLRREADRLFEQSDYAPARSLYERISKLRSDPQIEERLKKCWAEAKRGQDAQTENDVRAREAAVAIKTQAQRFESRKTATPFLLGAVDTLDGVDRLTLRGAPVTDMMAQLAGAEYTISRALAIDATYLEARLVRARLRHRLGDYAGAMEDFGIAVTDAPWSRQAFYGKAYTAFVRLIMRRESPLIRESDDLPGFEKEFEQSVEAAGQEFPSDAFERWAVMALQELIARNSESAYEKMKTIALEGKAQPAYFFILASIDLEHTTSSEKRFAASVANLTKLLELDPISMEGLFLRSVLRSRLNDPKAAREDAERLLVLMPNGPFPYLARAQASKLMGKYDEALKDLEKAGELDPKILPGLKREMAELQRAR